MHTYCDEKALADLSERKRPSETLEQGSGNSPRAARDTSYEAHPNFYKRVDRELFASLDRVKDSHD